MGKRIPPAIQAEIVRRWATEPTLTAPRLARDYQLSPSTIRKVLARHLSIAERQAILAARPRHLNGGRPGQSFTQQIPRPPDPAPLERLESAQIRQLARTWVAHRG